MRSILEGYGIYANKKYFEEKIFPFLFESDGITRGQLLELQLKLKKVLPKLQTVYEYLPDEI